MASDANDAPRGFSRRRLLVGLGLGLGAAPVLTKQAASAHEDDPRPEIKVLRQGHGFRDYTRGDSDAGLLFDYLVDRGFSEDSRESMLARDHAIGDEPGKWVAVTAAYTTMRGSDGAFVALSAIRASADSELRNRNPEAVIAYPPPASDDPVEVLEAVSGRVRSRK